MQLFKNKKNIERKRELSIDLIKAVAIFLMVGAHVVAFFYQGGSRTINGVQDVGDTVCFTLFLFTSGMSAYLAYFYRRDSWENKSGKLLRRTLYLLVGYYFVAIISSLDSFELEHIIDILTFKVIIGYTEFIIPFMVYSLLIYLFPRQLERIIESNTLVFIIGLFTYFLGTYLYYEIPAAGLEILKSLVVGQPEMYSFPVLQYFIVFLLGMNWAFKLKHLEYKSSIINSSIASAFYIGFWSFVIGYGLQQELGLIDLDLLNRWPPSFVFMAIGLIPAYVFLAFYYQIQNWVEDFSFSAVHFLSGKVFGMYIFHIAILQILYVAFDYKTVYFHTWVIIAIAIFIGSILLVQVLDFFKNAFSTTAKQPNVFGFVATFSLLMLTGGVSFALAAYEGTVTIEDSPKSSQVAQIDVDVPEGIRERWVDDYSIYKRVVVVENPTGDTLASGEYAKIIFDHNELVGDERSLPNGNDLKIFYNSELEVSEIPINIIGANKEKTEVYFEIQADLASGAQNFDYELYYGAGANSEPQRKVVPDYPDDKSGIRASLLEEKEHDFMVKDPRKWVLIGEELQESQNTYEFKIENSASGNNNNFAYEILDLKQKGSMKYKSGSDSYEANIATTDIKPGSYRIQAISKTDPSIRSNIITVNFSYPLYVVWSIDWEGYPVAQNNMDSMDEISDDYNIPMTQFFNPRYFVPSAMSASSRDHVLNYVKNRQASHGDSIGLHTHMFYDMVAAAGVEPSHENPWRGDGEAGKAIPPSNYTTEDMEKILEWGINKFIDNGLGRPVAYRAGGWYADGDTLEAVENVGFEIDSSGRTKYELGGVEGHWNLSPTTKPYQPSTYNQNSSAVPHLDIWEIPNNGADSWRFSGNQMIDRFKQNYPKRIMVEPQVVTYLSHPDAFEREDEPKMYQVFDYIYQYVYENDDGPVLFTTLEDASKAWRK